MRKIISFVRCRPPSVNGYPDLCTVINVSSEVLGRYHGRSSPDPRSLGGKIWDIAFGLILPGSYPGRWGTDRKGRECIIINEGLAIPAALPNANHGWQHIVTGAEVHRGYREDDPATLQDEADPGSAACCTIKTSQWDNHFDFDGLVMPPFKSLFHPEELVTVEIRCQ